MKTLILATTISSLDALKQIALRERPRIDYLDLQDRLAADVIDFSVYERAPYRYLERPDRLIRLAWGQALYAIRHWKDYDVVYSLSEDVGIPLELLLHLRGLRPRHIMIAHNVLSARKVSIVRSMRVMSRFHQIVVLSHTAVKGVVDTYAVSPDQVTFMPDAIDETFWQSDPGICVEPDYALSVGRARRDYPTLLKAVHDLPVRLRIQSGSQWHIVYSGIHSDADELPGNVEIGGYLSFENLRALYSRAGFVVIPLESGAHHSAGTVSIKEAMAMGKAVIVASDGGSEDYVHHGETGILLSPGDPGLLSQAITDLLADPERTKQMGHRGRALLEREMRYDDKIDKLASLAVVS